MAKNVRNAKVKADVKFSNNYRALMKMFPQLPEEANGIFLAAVKRDALRTVRNFKEGIKANSFGLVKLKDGTIQRKIRDGMSEPTYPLYGIGDESKKNSYMNMMRTEPMKGGYRVFPSTEMHHSGEIELNRMFKVHEGGMIITVKPRRKKGKLLKGSPKKKFMIRIPPRPAMKKAFRQAMRQRKTKETAGVLRLAILLFLKLRKKEILRKAERHFLEGLQQYEIRD